MTFGRIEGVKASIYTLLEQKHAPLWALDWEFLQLFLDM